MNPEESNTCEISAYHRLEIEEIFKRTRHYSGYRVQIATFFGTANLTVLGLAFTSQKAILLWVAAGLLLLWIVADNYAKKELMPFYYRGLLLENLYTSPGEDALLHIYLGSVKTQRNLIPYLLEIAAIEDPSQRATALCKFRPNLGGFWRPLIVVMLIEIILGLTLPFLFGWNVF